MRKQKNKQPVTTQLDGTSHSMDSIDDLLSKHEMMLDEAERLDIPWLTGRAKEARKLVDQAKEDKIGIIAFVNQAQEIQRYTNTIELFKHHSRQLAEDASFVKDFCKLTQSKYFIPSIYEKLLSHIQSDKYYEINDLANNDIIHPKAISELQQTLYDINVSGDEEGKQYLDEMIALVHFYCQEMKKPYAQDCQTRFRDGLVKLLAEYRMSREELTASVLSTLRNNLSYTGLGSLGVITFNIQNSRTGQSEPDIEPNSGQLALARVISHHRHHGLFGHKCNKHEALKEQAWEALQHSTSTKEQAEVLRDLASDIRQQHKSKSKIGGKIGSLFRHSKLAKQIDIEAQQLELAVEKASLSYR